MESIIKNFESNGFKTSHFSTKEQALEYLCKNILNEEVVFGGSMTLSEMGVKNALSTQNKTYYHGDDGIYKTDGTVYISSANALTKDGKIINIDGRGNRVSQTIYGPKRVFIVASVDKIEENLEKAMFRAKNIASPLNARRLNRNTPCVKGELKCYDCNSPERVCRATVILEKKPYGIDTYEVLLIDEKLGY